MHSLMDGYRKGLQYGFFCSLSVLHDSLSFSLLIFFIIFLLAELPPRPLLEKLAKELRWRLVTSSFFGSRCHVIDTRTIIMLLCHILISRVFAYSTWILSVSMEQEITFTSLT